MGILWDAPTRNGVLLSLVLSNKKGLSNGKFAGSFGWGGQRDCGVLNEKVAGQTARL